jgi:O-antigen/teichoic acid export membrane protein
MDQLRQTYLTSAHYLMFLNAAFCCLLVISGRELLYYWAGAAFGREATLILALVTCAVLADSFTNLPSLVIDGLGKPSNTGVFAFLRSLVGLAAAWVAVRDWGIEGVAWAQLGVSTGMTLVFLAWVHGRVVPATLGAYLRAALLPCVLPMALALGWATAFADRAPMPLQRMLWLGLLCMLLLAGYAWIWVLQPGHRARLLMALSRKPLHSLPVDR